MVDAHHCRCKSCDAAVRSMINSQGNGRFGVSLGDGLKYRVFANDRDVTDEAFECDTNNQWVLLHSMPLHVCANCLKDACATVYRGAVRMEELP